MKLSIEKQNEIINRKKKLQEVQQLLKQEFVGIDKVIDELIYLFESWYLFSEYQLKPLIINLWGMTGIGKTSLIKRVVELLDLDDFYNYRNRVKEEIGDVYLFPRNYYDDIYKLDNAGFDDVTEYEQFIMSKQPNELIEYIDTIIRIGNKPKEYDLSKFLIFNVGNLDEVYRFSSDMNPDNDADWFYNQTLKININDIKMALQKRFRNEQISRLGNNHIIYPAFSSDAYRKLIELNLNQFKHKVQNMFGLDIQYDSSLHNIIYKEGVYPTQGARPVLTTLDRLIESTIGKIINDILVQEAEISKLEWLFENSEHLIRFYNGNAVPAFEKKYPADLKIEPHRKIKKDDKQASVAIHECGHAIVAALTTRILPVKISCYSSVSNYAGSIQDDTPTDMMTKKLLKARIAIGLGGILAEKIVFGEDNISMGSSGDILKTTSMAIEAIKEDGMGSIPIAIQYPSPSTNSFFRYKEKYDNEAYELIEEGRQTAEDILIRNKELLLKMAKYLLKHPSMNKATMLRYFRKYAVEEWVRTDGFIKKEKYFGILDYIK